MEESHSSSVGNAPAIKKVNRNLLRSVLKTQHSATKQQLASLTGLTAMTVGTLLQELMASGEVQISEKLPSSGGRPAVSYCYNRDFRHILAVYVYEEAAHYTARYCIADLAGTPLWEEEQILSSSALPDAFGDRIEKLLQQDSLIAVISFGMPGVEDNDVITFNDLPKIMGSRLREYYVNRFHLPFCFTNDVNAAILGWQQNMTDAERDSIAVYLYFPAYHPPGSGLYLNGRPYTGSRGMAGEVSLIPLGFDWENVDYQDSHDFVPKLAKLLVTVSSVLNPDIVVFAGDFLNEELLSQIRQTCAITMREIYTPVCHLSDSFYLDYRNGVIHAGIDSLEEKLHLSNS